jgi:hypothetical protein
MKNFLKNIKKGGSRGFGRTRHINSHKHWIVLIKIFLAISLLLILLAFYVLYKIKNEQIFQVISNEEETPVIVNEKLLNEFNEALLNKETRKKEIEEGNTVLPDPS